MARRTGRARMHRRPPQLVRPGRFSPGAAAEDVGVTSSLLRAEIAAGRLEQESDGSITVAALGTWWSQFTLDHPEVLER